MDNLTPKQRKKNMQNIRSVNTKPEKIVMRELRKRKIYFASHVKKVFGTPDIVFRRKKVAVFIDSDFWHCNPKKFTMPKTNVEYWKKKIERNIQRDQEVNDYLAGEGWIVIRFWESELLKEVDICIEEITSALSKK